MTMTQHCINDIQTCYQNINDLSRVWNLDEFMVSTKKSARANPKNFQPSWTWQTSWSKCGCWSLHSSFDDALRDFDSSDRINISSFNRAKCNQIMIAPAHLWKPITFRERGGRRIMPLSDVCYFRSSLDCALRSLHGNGYHWHCIFVVLAAFSQSPFSELFEWPSLEGILIDDDSTLSRSWFQKKLCKYQITFKGIVHRSNFSPLSPNITTDSSNSSNRWSNAPIPQSCKFEIGFEKKKIKSETATDNGSD